MDGPVSDGTREDTEDTTMFLQIEEVIRVIRALLVVTKLSVKQSWSWTSGFPAKRLQE